MLLWSSVQIQLFVLMLLWPWSMSESEYVYFLTVGNAYEIMFPDLKKFVNLVSWLQGAHIVF